MASGIDLAIRENVPLAPLTTLKVGGPARFFCEARTEIKLQEALAFASTRDLPVFILGGGSNVLVADAGFDGLVIHIRLRGITPEPADPSVITAQAGEDWDEFVEYCVGRELAGVECLSGIPGFVGGTPVQNVGAYGQDVSETILSVRCVDREGASIMDLSNDACGFAYRRSIFNATEKDRYIVLSVTFRLRPAGPPNISYADLRNVFAGKTPTLRETRDAVLRIRAAKSMVIDPADPNSRSAGSFFKNPVVGRSELKTIARAAGSDAVPNFPAGGDLVKVPAAWLIERAGFHKGYALGPAGISSNHSLAIVNRGSAAAADIIALKDSIIAAVSAKFGIELVPEPIFIGFD